MRREVRCWVAIAQQPRLESSGPRSSDRAATVESETQTEQRAQPGKLRRGRISVAADATTAAFGRDVWSVAPDAVGVASGAIRRTAEVDTGARAAAEIDAGSCASARRAGARAGHG